MLVMLLSIWHFKVGNFSSLMVLSCTEEENGETQSGRIVARIYQSCSQIHRLRHDGWWFQVWKQKKIQHKLFREFREEFGQEEPGRRCNVPSKSTTSCFYCRLKLSHCFSYSFLLQYYCDFFYYNIIRQQLWNLDEYDLVYKKYKLCNLDKYHVSINYIAVTSISKHTIYRQRWVIDHYIHITNRFVKKN